MSEQDKRLTPLESLIMDAVWDLKKATVKEVREWLSDKKPMAYNTVLTMMRILRDKGFLSSKRRGKMDVYQAKVSKKEMAGNYLSDILNRFFAGSAKTLLSQLLVAEDIPKEELEAMRQVLNEKSRKQ